jgi:hypothetical protein
VALGPECLRGPFASFDPRLTPIWINLVEEMTSLPVLLGRGDPTAWAYLSSMALGGLALAVLLARPSGRNLQTALVGAVFLAASALTLAQIRNGAYALSLACPLLAAAVVNLVLRLRVPFRHRNVALLSAALLGTATPAGAGMLARFAQNASDGVESAAGPALPAGGGCSAPSSYAPLASLAPGLAVAPIDAGPFILMASPLSILSAPYHRNPEGILAAHAILTAPLPQAAALLRRRRARYVVICLHAPGTDLPARLAPQGLAAQLEAGATPSWLKPLAVGSGVVRVYELRAPPAAAGQAR